MEIDGLQCFCILFRQYFLKTKKNPKRKNGKILYQWFASMFTGGPILDYRMYCGVHSKPLPTNMNKRLPDHCNGLQAELTAAIQAASWLLNSSLVYQLITIYLPAQIWQKAVGKQTLTCRQNDGGLSLDFSRNSEADELARSGRIFIIVNSARHAAYLFPLQICRVKPHAMPWSMRKKN